jgi:5-methyltetrahydropteroyltriglutamate--homocysteine methyltransferase
MANLFAAARQLLAGAQLWINPDRGLKTRGWDGVRPVLVNMVSMAEQLGASA